MKATDETTVVLELKLFQATRIRDEFGRVGDIAEAVDRVVNEAYRQNAQAKEKAPDDALIPVTVELTMKQARTILKRYKELDGPTDHAIYILVKKAIDESE